MIAATTLSHLYYNIGQHADIDMCCCHYVTLRHVSHDNMSDKKRQVFSLNGMLKSF